MGLLDALSDPQNALAIGLLGAASSGRGFGGGLMDAVNYANAVRQNQSEAAFKKFEMDRKRQEWERADRGNALAAQFYKPGSPAIPAIGGDQATGILPSAGRSAVAPSFDGQGYASALMGIDPQRGLQVLQSLQKEVPVDKIDPAKFTPGSLAKFAQSRNYGDLVPRDKLEFVEGVGVNPFDPANNGRAIPNPNKPFSMDAQGNAIPNKAYQNYEISKAAAGAARTSNNISVNTEKSLLNGIASGVGSQIDASLAGARGAASTLNTLNNLDAALKSGKVMAGPLTAPSQLILQVGTQLGLAGKDAKETLQNTRSAMQAMAQLELDASAQMKGQGQITESERAILRRAASGDINMSLPELQTLSNVSRRTAQMRIQQHNQNVQPLLSNPNAAALAPFLTVPQPQQAMGDASAGGGQSRVVNFSDLK